MMRYFLLFACSFLCVSQSYAQPLQISPQFGVQVELPDDWSLLSEDLYASLLPKQLFASADEKYFVQVEKFGLLHELYKERWLEGLYETYELSDPRARQLDEKAWPFSKPTFNRTGLLSSYPEGVALFWTDAPYFFSYDAFISREKTFIKVRFIASKEGGREPDLAELKTLLGTLTFLPEMPSPTIDPYTEADRLRVERDYDAAMRWYKLVPTDHPEYVRAQRIIGYSILGNQMGKWQEAIPYVEEALSLAPDDPKVIEDVARVYLNVDREAEGIALLKEAGTPIAIRILESLENQ